jgi:hypothetical protein
LHRLIHSPLTSSFRGTVYKRYRSIQVKVMHRKTMAMYAATDPF